MPRRLVAPVLSVLLCALNWQLVTGNWKLDADAERWVAAALKKMTLDDKVGQLLVSSFDSEYMSTDSGAYEALVRTVHEYRVGGFHLFGGAEPTPDVLLGGHYASVRLGQPLAAASLINRLQSIAAYPLLNSADLDRKSVV